MPINEYGNLDFPINPTKDDLFVDQNNVQWKFNDIDWAIFEPYYINDLPDVSITNPVVGDQLEWDGTNWVIVENNELTITNLTDVTLTNPIDNDFLIWDGNQWVNRSITPFNNAVIKFVNFTSATGTSYNIIPFNIIDFTSDASLVDLPNHKLVVQVDGLYYISTIINKLAGMTDCNMKLRVYNSSNVLRKEYFVGTSSVAPATYTFGRSAYINLYVGDYINAVVVTSTPQLIEFGSMTLLRISDVA